MSTANRDEKLKTIVLLGSVLAVLGLGISLYSLYHHIELKYLGEGGFACNINDTLSCDSVANSKYSEDPWGNPLGVHGAGYFLGLLALLIVSRVKESMRDEALQAYAALVGIGVVVSLALAGISHFSIGKLCPTCMGIYAITFLQAAILFFSREALPRPFNLKQATNGAWYVVMALAVCVALFQMFKPSRTQNITLDVPKTREEIADLQKQVASSGTLALASLDNKESPSVKIDYSAYSGLGEDYRKGSDEAKVKIVEYVDFQCPACASASRVLRQLSAEYGDRILVVFKNYPLDKTCNPGMQSAMHPFACQTAVLARCVGAYGRFWEFANKAFDNQQNIDATRIVAWAKELGLADEQISQCQNSKDIVAKIQDDIRQGNESGLTGTPTLFINGRRYNGPLDPNEMRRVIDALLAS